MQGKDSLGSKYLKQARENGIHGMGEGIALRKNRDSLSVHGKQERK